MAEKRFIKGLFKDTGYIDQPEGSWRHAVNMVLNKTDGAVSNEGGTELAGHLGTSSYTGSQKDKVIGAVEVNDDKVVLFVTDAVTVYDPPSTAPRSEIGIWENGEYTLLFNPSLLGSSGQLTNDLNFRQDYPIEGTFKIDPKGDLIVYWTDDLNPPRAFNVDRQQRESTSITHLYGIPPANIDHINILNLFPYSGPVPHIDINDQGTHQGCVLEGGGLLSAVYFLALAYVDSDLVATNYLTVSNPIPIVDEFDSTNPTTKKDGIKDGSQTTKAIKWDISNLNTNYRYLRPVIIRSKGAEQEAFKLNDVEFSAATTSIIYSGLETISAGSVSEVIIDTIAYETAKTIQQLDNVLYLGNTTGTKDVGFQKYANNIKLRSRVDIIEEFDEFYASVDNFETGWGSRHVNDYGGVVQTVDPTKSYRYVPNIFKFKGYMRDEIYAFYIAFIMKDGSMSYAYHIPGRSDLYSEKEPVDVLAGNAYGGLWSDIYNVSPEYGKRFHWIDSTTPAISSAAFGGPYVAADARRMNYWENATELYPNTDNYEVWDESGEIVADSLKGLNVRHHHFPSNRDKDRTTILDTKLCRTTKSSGTTAIQQSYNTAITFFSVNSPGVQVGNTVGSYVRNRFNQGGGGYCTNDPVAVANLWNGSHTFTADQSMTVTVKWVVWFHQNAGSVTKPFRTRLRTTSADWIANNPSSVVNQDGNSASPYGSTGCGGSRDDANRQPGTFGNFALTGTSSGGGTSVQMEAGETLWIESAKLESGGVNYWQSDWTQINCYSSPPGQPNVCTTAGIAGTPCVSAVEFDIVSTNSLVEEDDLHDAKISHDVQRLGFDLEDIKIPPSIMDKVQGFRIYYAKRKHSDRTILGQSLLLPAMKQRTTLGICQEAAAGQFAQQVLGTLQTKPEDFYNLDPWPRLWSDYPNLNFYEENGGPTNDVGPINTGADTPAMDLFTFHDFYLLRSKNSLSPATHIDIQYYVRNLVWNGMSLHQDKKMVTTLSDPGGGSPLRVKETWGWDESQNCYPKEMYSAIFIGCEYRVPSARTQPRLIGQKAKTYLLGDSIFKGTALGFGGKLFNEFGESCIAFKLMDDHAIGAYKVRSYPMSNTIGYFADTYPVPPGNGDELPFGWYGSESHGPAILTNTLDSAGTFTNLPTGNSHHQKSQAAMANLKAFKTDVYKSIDSQELVWTGFEVLEDDLNEYAFDDDGVMQGSGKTIDTHPDGIYGGDTFICRYGIIPSIKHSNNHQTAVPEKSIHYHIVESTDNINFRHQEDDASLYFPQSIAKSILRNAGPMDFHHFDNMKYNANYSLNNDIRPAFPLPLRDTIQSEFPTRTHRSAKHDTTSIIDNYRIFLANQFKDLPKNRGDLWKLASFNNLLYFHMEESLFAAQGKQSMQMKDGSEAFVGSGDIFAQEPNEMVQTEDGFGGTQSQWASLTTRYGYFFLDRESKKVFLMADKLQEISNLGLENWFRDNLTFELEENYNFNSACNLDNPIKGMGFHSVYDPKFKRIILTKREFIPKQSFIDGWNSNTITSPCNAYPDGFIRFNSNKCLYEQWGVLKNGSCGWEDLDFSCRLVTSKFTCSGWTISYYPELGVWGSFHDYVPYIYFNTSTDFYSLTDKYPRPVWTQGVTTLAAHEGTTYGNAGIWEHNSSANHGILYQEWSGAPTNITQAEWLSDVVDHYSFEFEFIHNEYKAEDTLTSSFNYTLESFNQAGISVLEHGFTSFFLYNVFQMSGERNLEYLVNIRRIGNNWKVNYFRDMAAIAVNTNAYYMSTNTNVIGGINAGTITTSDTQNMFTIAGMSKTINAAYLDLGKNWDLQRKFIDKWVGIRLIYDNVSNNLLNLYSTDVAVRKMYR
tara:strand:+ start:5645 stop:11176 length:5532 start_codon:yes stop_codon:yes gene_type:complete